MIDLLSYKLGKKAGGGGSSGFSMKDFIKTRGTPKFLFAYSTINDEDLSKLLINGDEFSGHKTLEALFRYCQTITTIPEIDTSSVVDMSQMFFSCTSLVSIPEIDTSNNTKFTAMFSGCTSLASIPEINTSRSVNFMETFYGCRSLASIPEIDTSKAYEVAHMFNGCESLVSIPKMDLKNCTSLNYVFNNCKALTNLTVKNIKINLQIGNGTSWGHLLTIDSLINTIYELHNVGASRTLTVGSANLEKLTSVYVKLIDITDEMRAEDEFIDVKLPFVVCDSTDEGAILITDYVGEKNWTLA